MKNTHVLFGLGFVFGLGGMFALILAIYAVLHVLTGAGKQGRGMDGKP